jgi:pimeloyl-ACP methyl ester carboxylesterase
MMRSPWVRPRVHAHRCNTCSWWEGFEGRGRVQNVMMVLGDALLDVPKIACPTLVITTEGSDLASVDDTCAWQQTIPDSELLVLPGDSYHVAASHAVQCAQATLVFIARRDPAS